MFFMKLLKRNLNNNERKEKNTTKKIKYHPKHKYNNPFDYDKGQYIGQTRLHVSIGKTPADDNDFYKSLKNLYAVEYINQKEIKRVKLCFMTLHNVKQLMKKKHCR